MKQIFILIFSLLSFVNLNGQTNTLYTVPGDNFLTIGDYSSTNGTKGILFTGFRDIFPTYFGASIETVNAWVCCNGYPGSGYAGIKHIGLNFNIHDPSNLGANDKITAMSITSQGYIGIGTTTPNEKLEIGGNLRINNGENCSIFPTGHSLTFGGRQDYAHVGYLFRPSWGTPSSTYSNFQLQYASNSGVFTTAVMFTTDGSNSYINSGNVGIGTSSPNEKLEIGGNIKISNGENCSIFPSGHSLTFGGRQDYAHVSYIFRPSWGTPSSTYSNFQLQNATNNGVFTTAVMLTTDGGSSYINSGNFGIGTTTPDQKLTVKGKIHAEEVIVDLNVPVADYVFKPTYKLMSLPEVEQFVKSNSHLPEIPSAEEVSQKGMSMGEMQNKLLQKVEELTLYAIQQNKEIVEQRKDRKELEAKLSKQENQYNALLEKVELLTKQIEKK